MLIHTEPHYSIRDAVLNMTIFINVIALLKMKPCTLREAWLDHVTSLETQSFAVT